MPDGGTVHTVGVTPGTDPVTAAVAALIQHDATCGWCATASPGDPRCMERADLTAAWRKALRDASLNRAPAGGQAATTTGGSQ